MSKARVTYNIDILNDRKELLRLIKDVDAYEKSFNEKVQIFLKTLGEYGNVTMIREINKYNMPYATGELISACRFTMRGKTVTISCNSDHAIYVEFGTGVVGQTQPYQNTPNDNIGWKYNTVATPEAHDEDGWYYYDKNGSKRYTSGMPSRPFVHNTYLTILNKIKDVVKEVF